MYVYLTPYPPPSYIYLQEIWIDVAADVTNTSNADECEGYDPKTCRFTAVSEKRRCYTKNANSLYLPPGSSPFPQPTPGNPGNFLPMDIAVYACMHPTDP